MDTFVHSLEQSLGYMPKKEREEILADYREHFEVGVEKGRSEEEIAASLGDPRSLARQIRADYRVRQAEGNASLGRLVQAVLATAGLGFFNLIFIAGPFFALLAALIGLFAGAIATSVAGIVAAVMSGAWLIHPEFYSSYVTVEGNALAALLFGIGTTTLGIIFIIGCAYLAKYFYKGTVAYLKLNVQIIKGKE